MTSEALNIHEMHISGSDSYALLFLWITDEVSQLLGWSVGGRPPPVSAGAPTGSGSGSELAASRSSGDLISEDWWLRFSDYRLEDYYAVQAKLDNDAGRPFPTVPVNTPPDREDDIHTAVYGENSIGRPTRRLRSLPLYSVTNPLPL